MILAINTCLRKVEVALIGEGKVLYERSEDSDRDHTEKIFEFLKEIVPEHTPDKIVVIAGPGAFTSIRIGVVVANTIAFASQAEIYQIDLKTLFDQEGKPFPIFLSAGKSEIYELKSEKEFIKNDATAFLEGIEEEFYGDLSDTHLEALEGGGKKILVQKRGLTFGEAVIKLSKEGKLDNFKVDQAEAVYLKPPNISVSKKQI
ncbi:tRNA (adenosine(37)-N6)-threonylcarbamoyltransferase complex dimerization subunit type 1 TsaB [Candidatus Peregrinibacteria bacterium]|jgi:tRNA threonylcarbamoyl adenosine modification protein YeaZ|nr:tRNA (adenosine(37)-N6)-threonylcarbamoyltransferase complex dimerization subunit type 1 TsaB [Candidatus Peregrinibacteria bacterium]